MRWWHFTKRQRPEFTAEVARDYGEVDATNDAAAPEEHRKHARELQKGITAMIKES
jgi:hypothetical protein